MCKLIPQYFYFLAKHVFIYVRTKIVVYILERFTLLGTSSKSLSRYLCCNCKAKGY